MLKFLKSNLFFFLLLTIVVFALYGKSINFDFTYHDDNSLILEKADFLSKVTNFPKLFTTSCYYSNDFQYYRPILILSFLMETSIFGLNTKIYHLTNIILFILTLYLMYVFLIKLKLNAVILKLLILLVAVHPIFISTVVWIPARNDTLLAIFIFLSFIFFIKYLEKNNLQNLILYILFWTVALFTKETAVLFFLLYPLFIYCFGYQLKKKEIIKNIVVFVFIFIIYFYLRNTFVSYINIKYYFSNIYQCVDNIFTGISVYLMKLLIPYNIPIMLYKIKLDFINVVVDVVLIFILFCLFYKNVIDRKKMIFYIAIFFIGLVTTFLLQEYVYLNHRLILSLVGFVAIFACVVEDIIKKYNRLTIYFCIFFFFIFIIMFSCSFNQQNKYCNKYQYWISAYTDAPLYHGACYGMHKLYLESGNFDKAIEFLNKAAYNDVSIYYSDLALICYYEGKLDKAETLYKQSVDLGINKAQCYRNLSVIYRKRDNDIDKAIQYAKFAVEQEPYDDGYKQYLKELIKYSNEENNIL